MINDRYPNIYPAAAQAEMEFLVVIRWLKVSARVIMVDDYRYSVIFYFMAKYITRMRRDSISSSWRDKVESYYASACGKSQDGEVLLFARGDRRKYPCRIRRRFNSIDRTFFHESAIQFRQDLHNIVRFAISSMRASNSKLETSVANTFKIFKNMCFLKTHDCLMPNTLS